MSRHAAIGAAATAAHTHTALAQLLLSMPACSHYSPASFAHVSRTCSCAKLDYGTAQRIIDGTISLAMAQEDDVSAGRVIGADEPSASASAAVMEESAEPASAAAASAAASSGASASASGAGSAAGSVKSGIPAELWDPKRRPPITRKTSSSASSSAGSAVAVASYDAEGAGLPQQTCAGIVRDVRMMHAIAMARRRKRFAAGALALHRSKLTLALDSSGNPVGVTTYPIHDSNRVVEEFMLL